MNKYNFDNLIVHFVLKQNEPKIQDNFKEIFEMNFKTALNRPLHALFLLYKNAFPFDLKLFLENHHLFLIHCLFNLFHRVARGDVKI